MKKQLVKNSLTGILQAILTALLVFTVIPVFIKLLGAKEYGIFATIMVIGNLNTFINLGLMQSLVKFLAEQGKCDESDFDISVTLSLVIISMSLLIILAFVFKRIILINILNLTEYEVANVYFFYASVLLANFFLFVGQVFKSILDSIQKIDINNYLQIVYNATYWGSILVILLLGYGINYLGIAFLFSSILWLSLTIYFSMKHWGVIKLKGIRKEFKRITNKQLTYGVKIYASGMIAFFYEPFTKILISHFIGVTEVGFFDIALRIRSQIWGLISKIFAPLYPFLASLNDMNKVRKYVHDLEQKTFLVIVPIIVIFIFVIKSLITLWIGQNIEIISVTSMFILSAYMLAVTSMPNYQYLVAQGLAGKTIILQIFNVVFNALFFFLFLKTFGYYAAVIGNVAAILSSYVLSLYYQKKYLDSLIFDSFSQVSKILLVFVILLSIGFLVKLFIKSDLLIITIIPPTLALVTIVLYKLFKVITKDDIIRYTGNNKLLFNIGMKIFIW